MKTMLLCLHGWGGSKESFAELREALKGADLEILTPDLPGFGAEPEPRHPWTTDDYADWVVESLEKQMSENRHQKTERLFLLGHSHGGRIAIKLAARLHDPANTRPTIAIDHLYLCAAAGIRHPRHFKRIIGLTLAKAGKALLSIPGLSLLEPVGKKLLYKLVRVHDYEKASPVMRETLIKVSAEDLRPLLRLIAVPTDIFWGADDRMTPVGDAWIIKNGIRESKLQIFPSVRHGVHRDHAAVETIAKNIAQSLCA